jgi:hypothetical protein
MQSGVGQQAGSRAARHRLMPMRLLRDPNISSRLLLQVRESLDQGGLPHGQLVEVAVEVDPAAVGWVLVGPPGPVSAVGLQSRSRCVSIWGAQSRDSQGGGCGIGRPYCGLVKFHGMQSIHL